MTKVFLSAVLVPALITAVAAKGQEAGEGFFLEAGVGTARVDTTTLGSYSTTNAILRGGYQVSRAIALEIETSGTIIPDDGLLFGTPVDVSIATFGAYARAGRYVARLTVAADGQGLRNLDLGRRRDCRDRARRSLRSVRQ